MLIDLSEGILISIEDQQRLVKCRLLCAVMDLPAKASLLNCTQFNGAYGCPTCKHPGSTVCAIIIL